MSWSIFAKSTSLLHSGFQWHVDKASLEPGNYELSIAIVDQKEMNGAEFIKFTDKSMTIKLI